MTNVFVWTVGDVIGAILFGGLFSVYALFWVVAAIDKWRFKRRRAAAMVKP